MNQAFANFANMRAQNEQRQYQNNLLAMKQAQAQAAAEAAARQQEDMSLFFEKVKGGSATANDYSLIMAKYPKISEGIKRSWETLDEDRTKAQFGELSELYAALENDPQEFEKRMLQKLDAAKNSGNKEVIADVQEKLDLLRGGLKPPLQITGPDKQAQEQVDLLTATPSTGGIESPDLSAPPALQEKPEHDSDGKAILKTRLMTALFAKDPKKAKEIFDSYRAQEKQPLEVSKLQSEAMKQAVDAEYAARMAKEEFEKIKLNQWATKQERAVAWKNAATAESNSRAMWASLGMRADEMKNIKGPIAKIQQERQKEQTEKVKQGQVLNFTSEVQAADSMLRAGAELYNHPGLSSTVGTRQGRGAVSWAKGVLYQDVEDVKGAIDDLSSNTFLSKSPFLKGTQTKQDRDDIVSSYGSLKTTMSEKSIRTAIKAGIEASHRARMNLSRAYKMAPPPLNEKYLKLLSTKSQEEEKEAAKIKSREEMPLPEMPSENEALPTMKNMMGY